MTGQIAVAESRPLSETIATTDIDKMLHDYVKPAFVKMSPDQQKQAIDMLNKMTQG